MIIFLSFNNYSVFDKSKVVHFVIPCNYLANFFIKTCNLFQNIVYLHMKKNKYNRIKVVLAQKDITGKELSERLECSKFTVYNWCRNDRQPDLADLNLIAKALNCLPSELIIDKIISEDQNND